MHLITITRQPGWKELDEDEFTERDEIDEAKIKAVEITEDNDNAVTRMQNQIAGKLEFDTYLYPVEGETRPIAFDKPTIFLSSRVHCGETPASFFLQGVYEFMMMHQMPEDSAPEAKNDLS